MSIEEKKEPDGPIAPPPPASPETRSRGGCLTAFLIVMMIVNPLVAIMYLATGSAIQRSLDAPSWAIPVLGIFCIVNFVAAIALWRWKKWGFYAFVVSSLVALVINIMIGLPLYQVVFGPIGVVILYALLHKIWDQLEPGV